MPIFNKSSHNEVRKIRLNKVVATRVEMDRLSNKLKRTKSFEWVTHTSFVQLDASRQGAISKSINTLLQQYPNRKLNILDWGCGDGTAAKELAKNKKINVFGFSVDASKNWLNAEEVTFLQTAVEVLPRFLKKKKIKLDLIYSEAALKHMLVDYQVEHFQELFDVLNVGGKIFPDPVRLEPHHIRSLEREGFKVELKGSLLFSLTRIK